MKKLLSVLLAIIMLFSVSVTAFSADEEIKLNRYTNGEKLTVGVDTPEYYTVYVHGFYNKAALTVSVENEDIVSATVTEEETVIAKITKVCITGKKAGETTLTVTNADGASSKFTVKVLPKGINDLRVKLDKLEGSLAVDFLFSGLLFLNFLLEPISFIFAPIINLFS